MHFKQILRHKNQSWRLVLVLLIPCLLACRLHAKNIKPFSTLSVNENKIVIIDFYAMWCAPCLASMESFNQLSAHEDSQFIFTTLLIDTIHFKKAETFIAKFSHLTYNYYDDTGYFSKTFAGTPIPYVTILKNGNILWHGSKHLLDRGLIDSVISHHDIPKFTGTKETVYSNYFYTVTKRNEIPIDYFGDGLSETKFGDSALLYKVENWSVSGLIANMYLGFSVARIFPQFTDYAVDVKALLPSYNSLNKKVKLDSLTNRMGIRYEIKDSLIEVMNITVKKSKDLSYSQIANKTNSSWNDTMLYFSNVSEQDLRALLEQILNLPVECSFEVSNSYLSGQLPIVDILALKNNQKKSELLVSEKKKKQVPVVKLYLTQP